MKDYFVPEHTVIQYVRDKKGIPYGVVVAIKSVRVAGPQFYIGYSLCRKNDRFSKEMALKIAIGRAEAEAEWNRMDAEWAQEKGQVCEFRSELLTSDVPRSVRHMLPAFRERCKKYYKVNDEILHKKSTSSQE